MMDFFEGRPLSQQPHNESRNNNGANPQGQGSQSLAEGRTKIASPFRKDGPQQGSQWQTTNVLETANNKLQELMQLLYLLSRDPAVPQDARYHVTVAQSEIALLTRRLQNSNQMNEPPAAGSVFAASAR